MASPKILVCGSRNFHNWELLRNTLDKIVFEKEWIYTHLDGNWLPVVTIIHGNAKGADELADQWAVINWTELEIYPANWEKYGKKAGPIRNQEMLDKGKPDLVVAFPTKQSRGTWDMVRRARKEGIEVIVVESDGT